MVIQDLPWSLSLLTAKNAQPLLSRFRHALIDDCRSVQGVMLGVHVSAMNRCTTSTTPGKRVCLMFTLCRIAEKRKRGSKGKKIDYDRPGMISRKNITLTGSPEAAAIAGGRPEPSLDLHTVNEDRTHAGG